MPRLTWLADELRKAGLRVVEVDGWKTRGSEDFHPEGMTWHATAGSRSSTAQAEVRVILTGSATAPAPISQLMLYRDGTIYVCAAGRCNHNKVGWDGPNKGLGNTRLLGMEMANDNRGEPWPAVQLDAARRATAVILKRLNVDPMRRLAAHYEHQPYATRPPGEGSTKSDPYGVRMSDERLRVAALMQEDDVSVQDVITALKSAEGQKALAAANNVDNVVLAPGVPKAGTNPDGTPVDTHWAVSTFLRSLHVKVVAIQAAVTSGNQRVAGMDTREAAEVPLTEARMVQLLNDAIPDSAGPLTPDEARAAVLGALRQAFTGETP